MASLYCYCLQSSGGVYKKSWVIESPRMVEESRRWDSFNSIMFSSSLETVISQNQIDIFFSSGTIQSLPLPLVPLVSVAKLGIPLVALTRNNFSAKSKVVAQRSTLSMNGTGAHIKNYGNPAIYYPNTSIVKSELINIFSSNGYNVILDTSGTSSGVYGNECYSGDLVFMKM